MAVRDPRPGLALHTGAGPANLHRRLTLRRGARAGDLRTLPETPGTTLCRPAQGRRAPDTRPAPADRAGARLLRGRREALRPHVLSRVTGADVTLKAKGGHRSHSSTSDKIRSLEGRLVWLGRHRPPVPGHWGRKCGVRGWGLTPEPSSPQASGLRLSHVNPLRLPRTRSTHRAQNARLITPLLLIPRGQKELQGDGAWRRPFS